MTTRCAIGWPPSGLGAGAPVPFHAPNAWVASFFACSRRVLLLCQAGRPTLPRPIDLIRREGRGEQHLGHEREELGSALGQGASPDETPVAAGAGAEIRAERLEFTRESDGVVLRRAFVEHGGGKRRETVPIRGIESAAGTNDDVRGDDRKVTSGDDVDGQSVRKREGLRRRQLGRARRPARRNGVPPRLCRRRELRGRFRRGGSGRVGRQHLLARRCVDHDSLRLGQGVLGEITDRVRRDRGESREVFVEIAGIALVVVVVVEQVGHSHVVAAHPVQILQRADLERPEGRTRAVELLGRRAVGPSVASRANSVSMAASSSAAV